MRSASPSGEEGLGGSDLLDLQDAGRKGVFLDVGVGVGLFRERCEACEVVVPAQSEPGGMAVPIGIGKGRMVVGATQGLEESGAFGGCPVGKSGANSWRTDCRKSDSS